MKPSKSSLRNAPSLALSLLLAANLLNPTACLAQSTLRPATARNPAPAWELKDMAGKDVRAADFKGKVVVLSFYTRGGPPFQLTLLQTVHEKYGTKGVVVLGLCLAKEDVAKLKPFIDQRGIKYPMLQGTQPLQDTFGGVESIPTTILIDSSARIAAKHVGFVDQDTLEPQIETLLAEAGGNFATRVSNTKPVPGPTPPVVPPPATRQPVPSWESRDSQTNDLQSADFQGRVVAMNFCTSEAEGCLAQIIILQKLRERYDELAIVGVVLDDDGLAKLRRFMDQTGVKYPLIPGTGKLRESFGEVKDFPTTFLIDSSGRMAVKHVGFVDRDTLEPQIARLLQEARLAQVRATANGGSSLPTEAQLQRAEKSRQYWTNLAALRHKAQDLPEYKAALAKQDVANEAFDRAEKAAEQVLEDDPTVRSVTERLRAAIKAKDKTTILALSQERRAALTAARNLPAYQQAWAKRDAAFEEYRAARKSCEQLWQQIFDEDPKVKELEAQYDELFKQELPKGPNARGNSRNRTPRSP